MCTAVQIALVDLFRSWNIHPSSIVGHSSGEIAAAYCYGGLSKESAWKVAYYRGALASTLTYNSLVQGAMMVVALSESSIQSYIDILEDDCGKGGAAIGCVNSPMNVTLTGSEDAIDKIKVMLDREKIFSRKLKVTVPYHSEQMKLVEDEYRSLLKGISACKRSDTSEQAAVMFSSVSGDEIGNEISDIEYWIKNMVYPVRFFDAVSSLISKPPKTLGKGLGSQSDTGVDHFVEIGPYGALQRQVQEIKGCIQASMVLKVRPPSDASL